MANMLNSARQAKERALKVLSETEKYVSGVNKDGKNILYYLVGQKKDDAREVNRAIGGIDSILSQYGDTSAKKEMLKLRGMLEDRELILRSRSNSNL